VVFIIKKENHQIFEETVGARVRGAIEVRYAFQDINDIPEGFSVPEGRVKPWGTAHALLCAKDAVDGDNFAVINSDDFYGADSYAKVGAFLRNIPDDGKQHYCMCGFILKNTLSENGHVARGICIKDDNDHLTSITERTKIQRNDGQTQFYEDDMGWVDVSEDSIVSMNMWGFEASFFDEIESRERAFFENLKNPLKDEFLLPNMVDAAMKSGAADVTVLQTMAKWYGVTYHEDKETVQKFISDCIADNVYPGGLWK